MSLVIIMNLLLFLILDLKTAEGGIWWRRRRFKEEKLLLLSLQLLLFPFHMNGRYIFETNVDIFCTGNSFIPRIIVTIATSPSCIHLLNNTEFQFSVMFVNLSVGVLFSVNNLPVKHITGNILVKINSIIDEIDISRYECSVRLPQLLSLEHPGLGKLFMIFR